MLVAHAGFVAFTVLGGLLVRRRPWLAWVHVPAFAWGVWIALTGGICPLTPLENALRRGAGQAGYAGGFLGHYLEPVLYPGWLTREVQIGLGVAVLLWNLALYGRAFAGRRPPGGGRPGLRP